MSEMDIRVDGDEHPDHSHAMRSQCIGTNVSSMLVDTGCNFTLGSTRHNKHLRDRVTSNVTVEMATAGAGTKAEYMGTLPVYALNTSDQVGYPE